MIIPPNDACPIDMEPDDFMQYLMYRPMNSWTDEQIVWVAWWVRGRKDLQWKLKEAQYNPHTLTGT